MSSQNHSTHFASLLLIIALLQSSVLFAQDHSELESNSARNTICYFSGLTLVPEAHEHILEGANTYFVSTIGLQYDRIFNHWFELGLMADIELAKYFISVDDMLLERENVFIFALIAKVHLWKGLKVYLGPGYEFERNMNFYITRAGIEYELEVANGWYVGPDVMFDFKSDYETISIGVMIGKRF